MSEYIVHYLGRLDEWKKAESAPSTLLSNALELIDGSLWLIAGGRLSLAVSALHNAIELAFKAELEKVHRVLLVDTRQLDYKSLKSLLKESFLDHPQGKGLVIDDYDLEKTITFSEALSRIKELFPWIDQWNQQLRELQSTRNDIVHRGSGSGKHDEYAYQISTCAFPFLLEFLRASSGIDLKRLVGWEIYRELDVATAACVELKRNGQSGFRKALKTVQCAMIYRNVDFPEPTDSHGFVAGNFDREFETANSVRSYICGGWSGVTIDVHCKICGSIHAFAEVLEMEGLEEIGAIEEIEQVISGDMDPLSLTCAVCGLNLSRGDGPLPRLHYGPISAEDVKKSLRENGW